MANLVTHAQIVHMSNLTTENLDVLINVGYPKDKFVASEFIGLNDKSQFVYRATYFNDIEGDFETCKVFCLGER